MGIHILWSRCALQHNPLCHLPNTQEGLLAPLAWVIGKENHLYLCYRTRYACKSFREIWTLAGKFFVENAVSHSLGLCPTCGTQGARCSSGLRLRATLLKPWDHLLSRLRVGSVRGIKVIQGWANWPVTVTQKLLKVSSRLTTAGSVSQYYKVLSLHIRPESTDKLNGFCKTLRSYVTSNPIQVLKQKRTSFLLSDNYPQAFSTKNYHRNQRAESSPSYNTPRCHVHLGSDGSVQRQCGCTC